jgi:hypothetical protein
MQGVISIGDYDGTLTQVSIGGHPQLLQSSGCVTVSCCVRNARAQHLAWHTRRDVLSWWLLGGQLQLGAGSQLLIAAGAHRLVQCAGCSQEEGGNPKLAQLC